jgi:uncharacterized protein YdhG (YjbR/CyaY superfamily)
MGEPSSVDGYPAALPQASRPALEKLRKVVRAPAPRATEALFYGVPASRDHRSVIVAYAAFHDHCSLFPLRARVIKAHRDKLRPYSTGKGTMRFTAARPLPAALVRRMVEARIAENAERAGR